MKMIVRKTGSMFVGPKAKKTAAAPVREVARPQTETNEQFIRYSIENRDYSGASTYIEFLRDEMGQPYTKELALWNGYCLFHLGDYSAAMEVFVKLLEDDPDDDMLHLYIASCHFYNKDWEMAKAEAEKGPNCDLKSRLMMQITQQTADELQVFQWHSQLVGTLENQLSLASLHYIRANYTDAIDIYEKQLQQHPEFLALWVYIAMCQFKLDQFEESNESVDQYLAINSDSAMGLNLKACNYFHLFDAEVAESQLLQIRKFASATYTFTDSLIKHNVIVFHDGAEGLRELPPLVAVLPEARFNLAVLYMRENQPLEAYNLIQSMKPADVLESILKATVLCAVGQVNSEIALIEEANRIFGEVGQMDAVCDTVPGRQCLTASKFIVGDYDEVLKVLGTIEGIVGESDEFCYNKAMSLASLSRWAEAERYFTMVKNPSYIKEVYYTSWYCRCLIKNKKYDAAWNLYAEAVQTDDAKTLLSIIATDCFECGAYYYSMKAYEMLNSLDVDPVVKQGMIAAGIGVFRGFLSKKDSAERVSEVLVALSGEPEAAEVLEAIQLFIETADDEIDDDA
jgi:intraflagellar transport protein 56